MLLSIPTYCHDTAVLYKRADRAVRSYLDENTEEVAGR